MSFDKHGCMGLVVHLPATTTGKCGTPAKRRITVTAQSNLGSMVSITQQKGCITFELAFVPTGSTVRSEVSVGLLYFGLRPKSKTIALLLTSHGLPKARFKYI